MARKKRRRRNHKQNRKAGNLPSGARSKLTIESLDQRILLDASGILSRGFDIAKAIDLQQIQTPFAATESVALNARLITNSAIRHEVIFVDAGVEDQQALLKNLQVAGPGVVREVVQIDAQSNGLRQMADSLRGRRGIDAIHVISHGASGRLDLGNASITSSNLESTYANDIRRIGAALDENADILFYGCDLSSGRAGRDFVRRFSGLSGADVAASNDVTGHVSRGGDWILESHVGQINTQIVVSQQGQNSLLMALGGAVPTATLDLPAEEMINENFQFSVTFDNTSATSTDTGYAPYIDLSVPDGVDISGASFLRSFGESDCRG